jgi:hypothetical protein
VASAGFQGSEPFFKSGNAACELVQIVAAVPRCSGRGRGPRRAARASPITAVRRLRQRRELGDDAGEDAGEVGIRCHGDQLILPQVDIPLGKARKVRRCRHDAKYIGAARQRPAEDRSSALQHPFEKAVMLDNHQRIARGGCEGN